MSTNYRNCVEPPGRFKYGVHKPSYSVTNLRKDTKIETLGQFEDGQNVVNEVNFVQGDITVEKAQWIYEIPNPFPFRGTTYIDKGWADSSAENFSRIRLPKTEPLSFRDLMRENNITQDFLEKLPSPVLLTLATCSTDPEDLKQIAEISCKFQKDSSGEVTGLFYKTDVSGRTKSIIYDHDLFEAVANNPALPTPYKQAMVLRPGAQGGSEIVGEWPKDEATHVFEYLRRNSYIAGGHYASNMSDDAVRYSIDELSEEDMTGLRHLYYQRVYVRLAELLNVSPPSTQFITPKELEEFRLSLLDAVKEKPIQNYSTLWGWNFGFDFAPTRYRLHASHQQIHQQYAMIPEAVETWHSFDEQANKSMSSFSSGDMIREVIETYHQHNQSNFFKDYYTAIQNNRRMDERPDGPNSLIVWQDDNVMILVPKAQTSQWELQIMTKPDNEYNFIGNILEADDHCRRSLDKAILTSQRALAKLGAKMVTSIEFSKRLTEFKRRNQPLIYSLLPKIPYSPGAFSEAQLRFINGHYPEDFAAACRSVL